MNFLNYLINISYLTMMALLLQSINLLLSVFKWMYNMEFIFHIYLMIGTLVDFVKRIGKHLCVMCVSYSFCPFKTAFNGDIDGIVTWRDCFVWLRGVIVLFDCVLSDGDLVSL